MGYKKLIVWQKADELNDLNTAALYFMNERGIFFEIFRVDADGFNRVLRV